MSVLMEEQRRTEQSLRESEEHFRNMANTVPVMIWISGPDKLGNFFSKGWLEFTGRNMEAEQGYGWASAVHLDQRSDCLTDYSSSFDARRLWYEQYLLQRADGEYRWVLCSGAPRFDADGIGSVPLWSPVRASRESNSQPCRCPT